MQYWSNNFDSWKNSIIPSTKENKEILRHFIRGLFHSLFDSRNRNERNCRGANRKEQLSKSQTDLPWKKASWRLKGRIQRREKPPRLHRSVPFARPKNVHVLLWGGLPRSGISNHSIHAQNFQINSRFPNRAIKTKQTRRRGSTKFNFFTSVFTFVEGRS